MNTGSFAERHIGPSGSDICEMLDALELKTIDELISKVVPERILLREALKLPPAATEHEALKILQKISEKNQIYRSYIGMGYQNCHVPSVIQRNIFENPGWYTQYTPYQPEISQGRLEALLNFQTVICDLTGLDVANASLLDESTAAAEAMTFCHALKKPDLGNVLFVSNQCHPQTLAVVGTRAAPLGLRLEVGGDSNIRFDKSKFAYLFQYPNSDGQVVDYRSQIEQAHAQGALVILAADLLSLTLLMSPGELGADVAIGSSQRFGVPLGFGGPHAAFFATRDAFKRRIPGRIVGVSKDTENKKAYRLALQTREQHIRREKATSNICTSQVLLAVMAGMYAVYHGPEGLKQIALRIHSFAVSLRDLLRRAGFKTSEGLIFDTLRVDVESERITEILKIADSKKINFRRLGNNSLSIALDETVTERDIRDVLGCFGVVMNSVPKSSPSLGRLERQSPFLTHAVFHQYRSETEMMRYIRRLESRDLSLTTSMIPLGSCTMKLNAASELLPISWPLLSQLHPFAPENQTRGYRELFDGLQSMLCELTGFDAVSLQPNAGSQGEYAGLLVICKYHSMRGESHRDVCLIPRSAHGTNPASAAMAGMNIIVVECDTSGNIDLLDLQAKAEKYANKLSCLMLTYPSTHGVFEEGIEEICAIVHNKGGQVYMDGANLNAQVGLSKPGWFGVDVCHLNLHKTFCIPHGGGGPGMGPIGVKRHLATFLPSHPVVPVSEDTNSVGTISAAPWGSPSILPIAWMYITMMGPQGLRMATEAAILNANYIAKRLEPYFPILYKGKYGFVAHECILDLRPLKGTSGVEVEDVAKRLIDYGFHAPTVSFPVPGTLMVEPTESESKQELDRFCEAMITIRAEIREIEQGRVDRDNNLLKNAPHTVMQVVSDKWSRTYSRGKAAFPLPWVKEHKFWPSVSRVDGVYGDRNLICSCQSNEFFVGGGI